MIPTIFRLRLFVAAISLGALTLLAACSGGSSGNGSGSTAGAAAAGAPTINGSVDAAGNPVAAGSAAAAVDASVADQPTSGQDAVRFLDQASFGPSASLVADTMRRGVRKQLMMQLAEPASRYTYTLPANSWRDQIHTSGRQDFCSQFTDGSTQRENCWRDWYASQPVVWDFFRQATTNRDQLRQRMAFALSQIFVISGVEVDGSYGFAEYQQMLRDNAFGNLRTLLHKVTLSPMMGRYLNMVDNDGADPNENYGRELLQLFTVGTCLLNPDGSLSTGKCVPVYDNTMVRAYAYALSGWTFPPGGVNPWCSNCNGWKNPTYLRGDMVAVAARHDSTERQLLSGVKAAAGRTPQQGLAAVLDSIMAHPNVGPFIGKQLIQHLVTSNPSAGYVARVAAAFNTGVHSGIGTGSRGDLSATLAAVLLDDEARNLTTAAATSYGRLKDPVGYILGAIRVLDGITDGEYFGQWGPAADMGQPVFNAPSVFNFYPPDFPLPGSSLVAPQFGIHNANTALARINFANDLVYWWYNKGQGLVANPTIANATGTRVSYANWENQLVDPARDSDTVVEQLNQLLTAGRLSGADKQAIVTAMNSWTPADTWLTGADSMSNWKRERVKTAVYLILASPHYQVQR